jgi:inositol hexakisphosphate/diphosphoinositol-pentakisphosphate kinase
VKLPKSFVAIDLSQSLSAKGKESADAKSEDGERGRSEERRDEILLPIADELGNVTSPRAAFDTQESKDGDQLAALPPPALGA